MTFKRVLFLIFVLALIALSIKLGNCQTEPRVRIGNSFLRDTTISGKRYLEYKTDTLNIFRDNTSFEKRLFLQNVYFDTINASTRMNTDTIFQGSHSLVLKFDNGSRIVWDSLGNTNYWSSANANNWYLLNSGILFLSSGLVQNSALSFHNYLYKTALTGGNGRPDSLTTSGVYPWKYTGFSNNWLPRQGDIFIYKAGTGWARPTSYVSKNNANRTLWVKEDSATYARDSLSGFYSVKTNSYTTINLTGSSATIPMLHSVINLRFDAGSSGFTLNADSVQVNRGVAGGTVTLIITDTTVSDRVISFTGFISASGDITTTGNNTTIHTITFACLDGRRWYEVSRTLNLTRIN